MSIMGISKLLYYTTTPAVPLHVSQAICNLELCRCLGSHLVNFHSGSQLRQSQTTLLSINLKDTLEKKSSLAPLGLRIY